MPHSILDIAEWRAGQALNTLSAVAVDKEVRDAIRKAFRYEGDLRVRHLWSTEGGSRFRANWYREVEGRIVAVKSLFLCVRRTAYGLVVQDETAGR